MNRKILFVANIHKHFMAFHIPYINYLQELGYEVHVAANDGETRVDEADKQFDISIDRNPFSFNNLRAIKELKNIINQENYCLIHCHTAMGSVVARLAAKSFRKQGLKVLYTAHGFHFYKGSPKKYWLLYFPMEKYLSRYTDGIITINQEDYKLINSRKFKNSHTFLTSGVGVNLSKFNYIEETALEIRKKNGYDKSEFLLLYIAEFIDRKNHQFLLACADELKRRVPNVKILLAGRGEKLDEVTRSIQDRKLDGIIEVLGFRTDIGEIIKMIDVGISVSHQEGLPMNVAEELYMGKPVVATKIRGHVDLIKSGENGVLFTPGDKNEFIDNIDKLHSDKVLYKKMSLIAKSSSQEFSIDNCLNQTSEIYKKFLPN